MTQRRLKAWLSGAAGRIAHEIRCNPVRVHSAVAALVVVATRYAPGVNWAIVLAFVATVAGIGEATRANVVPTAKIFPSGDPVTAYKQGYEVGYQDTAPVIDVTPPQDRP